LTCRLCVVSPGAKKSEQTTDAAKGAGACNLEMEMKSDSEHVIDCSKAVMKFNCNVTLQLSSNNSLSIVKVIEQGLIFYTLGGVLNTNR
jgi:hypothetical protein